MEKLNSSIVRLSMEIDGEPDKAIQTLLNIIQGHFGSHRIKYTQIFADSTDSLRGNYNDNA